MNDETGQVEFIGFWYRLGAFLWDGVIVGALTGGVAAILIGDQLKTEHGGQLAGLLLVLLATAYTLGFWILTATTPGKWLCSSRIVDVRTGGKPRPWQFLLRYLGYLPSAALLLTGFLWMIWQKRRRTWHDLLAKTAVIGDASLRRPSAEEGAEATFCLEAPPWRTG